ncbi:GNAT family N-acetyltransferase [Micromonospora taraxaci]|uniref:GNAT family N-acetyltransferase n=1 Tax=Micromonospora taraxaci TaxID=1316803 RepID=UPI0033FC8327
MRDDSGLGSTLPTMFAPVKIISGGLEIREFGPQDATQLAAFVAADDRTGLPPGSPQTVADVDEWLTGLSRQRLAGDGVRLAMVDTAEGEIVGSIGLRDIDWRAGRGEIGYGVRASRRGRGYATTAAREVGRWALTDCGMRRIQLRARLDNIASLRVAERAGYQREGTLRMADWDGEKAHDMAVFSMIAADVEAVRVTR